MTREQATAVLDACPNADWRLIFALARFGGLRTPSETLLLRWSDVDWEHGRMTVHSPKTEHHDGKGSRLVPIFSELRPYLLAAFEQAPDGSEYVIQRYRDSGANLRTQLDRVIKRAGLELWPKTFHTLRSSRQTELAADYPLHVVCAWIGNSALIASKHYLTVRDEDYRRAVEGDGGAAQNPAQQAHAKPRNPPWRIPESASCDEKRKIANCCGASLPPRGLEQTHVAPPKTPISESSGAKSGALGAPTRPEDPGLQAIIDAWPRLSEAVRAGILAMAQAASAQDQDDQLRGEGER